MTDLWPCAKCDDPAVRNLGTQGWCALHLEKLYDTFDPSTFALRGVGRSSGPLWPEFGPHHAELRCNACAATWVGVPGEACEWCQESLRRMLIWQAEQVLEPPDVDLSDERFTLAIKAWADRLWVAVEAEIIHQRDAERAITRETRVA